MMEAYLAAVVVFYFIDASHFVEARLCKIEIDGQITNYGCPRNEYCCNKGCCISPTFQFYQLWYYWLMVIFMLVVCSGGQWWYRYWVNGGRYFMPAAHVTVTNGNSRTHHRSPIPRSDAPSTRVVYHPTHGQGSAIVFWKPPYAGRTIEPPPSYAVVVPPSPKPPYIPHPSGPPPSYESVVGLSNPLPQDPGTTSASSFVTNDAQTAPSVSNVAHHQSPVASSSSAPTLSQGTPTTITRTD